MKILVVAPGPSFSVVDVQRGWEKALRNLGHDVRTYNLDDRLAFFGSANVNGEKLDADTAVSFAVEPLGSACYKWWPDVILVISGFFIPEDIWRTWQVRSHKVVLLCTESPYEDDRQFEQAVTYTPDVVLLNDPASLEIFQAHHPCTVYAPHAYDPDVHYPRKKIRKDFECDFAFVGTAYQSRIDFLSRVDWRGLNVKFAGNFKPTGGTCLEQFVIHDIEDCFENTDTADLYCAATVNANLYRARAETAGEANDPRLTEGWAIGPREVELAAMRRFFLREPRPEGDTLFPFLPTFTEPGEFGELLRYYLSHPKEREDAARRAQQAVADRTFDAHARRLMQLLPD